MDKLELHDDMAADVIWTSFVETPKARMWRRINIAVPLTFGILATMAYLMRLYATVFVTRRVRMEDYFMGCSVILMFGTTAAVLLKAFNGIGLPDSDLPHYTQIRFKLGSWLVIKFWSASMVFGKLAIILFLRRVVGGRRASRVALDIIAVLVVIWGASNFFYTVWFCKPVSFYWDRSIKNGWCVDNDLYMIESKIIAAVAVVMDVIILAIPIPTIWNVKISVRQKLGVTFILCIGVIVCVFSLLRAVQFSWFDTANLSTSSILEGLWTVLENQFTVLCGCLPQLGPLLRKAKAAKESSAAKCQGYVGSYDPSKRGGIWGFEVSAVETSVYAPDPREKRYNCSRDQNSSEFELKGIEVQTTIDQEVYLGPRGNDARHVPRSVV